MSTLPSKSGVMLTDEGTWTWQCPKCQATAATPVPSRAAARDAYKIHRRQEHGEDVKAEPAATTEEPQAKEKKVTTKATKKVKKTTTKKKSTSKKKAIAKKKSTPKKKSTKKPGRPKTTGKLWRIGFMKSPKTGREICPGVNREGFPPPYLQKAMGIKQVPRWGRIQAKNRREALSLLREGYGDWFTPKKGEK